MKKNMFIAKLKRVAVLLAVTTAFTSVLYPSAMLPDTTNTFCPKKYPRQQEQPCKDVKGAKTKKTSHRKTGYKVKYTKACLNCKKAGKASSQTKFVIPSSTKVIVLKQKNKKGWTKIKCSRGKGFVMDRYLTARRPRVEVDKDENEKMEENPSDIYDRGLAKEAFDQVNRIRTSNGLKALAWDSSLVNSSDTRAMEASAVWSHMRPDGSSWQTVSENCHGENLARRFATAEDVCNGWMNSQGHRENILRGEFTRASVSVCVVNGTYYWCQSFGY